jgi:predicted GNAT family acetyltransferase
MPPAVDHDPTAHRFTAKVSSGTAVLSYAQAGPGVLDLYSTYVPSADRGKGVAARLVETAIDYARSENLRIIPSCWYVNVWMQRHPEHADLLSA